MEVEAANESEDKVAKKKNMTRRSNDGQTTSPSREYMSSGCGEKNAVCGWVSERRNKIKNNGKVSLSIQHGRRSAVEWSGDGGTLAHYFALRIGVASR